MSAQFGFFKKNNDVLHNEIAVATEEKYVCRLAKRTLAEVRRGAGSFFVVSVIGARGLGDGVR